MRAGQLNRRLQLQKVTTTTDAEGFSSETWSTVDTVWAQIQPAQGREEFQGGQTVERITHAVSIRYRTDVTPKMRFLYGSRNFLIHSMYNVDEANHELVCGCEEFVSTQVGAT